MNEDVQYVFLDTSVLEPYFFSNEYKGGKDQKSSSHKIIEKISNSIKKNPGISVKIPQVVIGELITNYIMDDEKEKFPKNDDGRALQKLKELLRQKLKADPVRNSFDSIQIAQDLLKGEKNWNTSHMGNDALIAGAALSDKSSSHLITWDEDILRSNVIKQTDKKLQAGGKRMRSLKIRREF